MKYFTASECIERRCRRPESELVRDGPEEELIEELALISEIRNVLNRTLNEINAQQDANQAARERLERDWSDKKHAYQIDSINSSLNDKSWEKLFKPGATRFMDEYVWFICFLGMNFHKKSYQTFSQSTEDQWETFTQHALIDCEEIRQKSASSLWFFFHFNI